MLQEWRLRHGLMTSLLMGVVTVAALSFASLGVSLSVRLQAGVLWLAVLFGMFPALARGFISEEELGTADLLRLGARPSCVFWGKWLFHLTLYIVLSAVLVPLYMLMIAPLAGAWWACTSWARAPASACACSSPPCRFSFRGSWTPPPAATETALR